MKFKSFFQFLLLFFVSLLLFACNTKDESGTETPNPNPKREFRGAWIATVGSSRYKELNSEEIRHYITDMVQGLYNVGINAIIYQVRPEADAFYKSNLEPWSRFLTGKQGQAPDDPTFDPLEFIIEECHKRGMELHAWINPYRVKSDINSELASDHIYWDDPRRYIEYGELLLFDPGVPENRVFTNDVVRDIVSRYDVDAIHMDDYFYPYPIDDMPFPDDVSFNTYASSQGFSTDQQGDWRRNNVNLLIQEIKQTIVNTKPWVRFGISPFGIYRNKTSTLDGSGSETNGLQNYDDLYADIKLWVEKGWIDYNMPQLYFEIGHELADYTTLAKWWNDNNFEQPLYFGQSVMRSMKQNVLEEKIYQSRTLPFVDGNCYWPGNAILNNEDAKDILATNLHKAKSLIPAYTHMYKGSPAKVKNLIEEVNTEGVNLITWKSDNETNNPKTANNFVVYRFGNGERIDINDATKIVKITPYNYFVIPYENGETPYTYAITALDAYHNESEMVKIKVKH